VPTDEREPTVAFESVIEAEPSETPKRSWRALGRHGRRGRRQRDAGRGEGDADPGELDGHLILPGSRHMVTVADETAVRERRTPATGNI